jgi:tetratricopeptide (TPR) repeat protein
MKKIGYAGLSIALCLASALPVLAQQAPSAAELACNSKYGKYYADQKTMALADEFLNDPTCKDSMYREGTFQLMAKALIDAMNWKGAMDLTTRFAKDVPNATPPGKQYVYGQGLTAASQARDADKMIEIGEKLLAVDANNLNAMLIVSTTLPEKLPADAAAKEAALNRSMELAKKLLAMPKPGPVDEKVWQLQVLSPSHSVVGFVLLQKKQYQESLDEFMQSTKIDPKAQVAWFRGGLAATSIAAAAQDLVAPAYAAANAITVAGPEHDAAVEKRDAVVKDFTEKRDRAIDILISAVALGGPIANQAQVTLESLYKPLHANTTEGLDKLIADKKAELNK